MKKILVLALVLLLGQGVMMAQKAKSVQEKDVPERFVKDFHNKVKNAKNISWTIVDSMVYDATYANENGDKIAYRFSPKGTETRWFVETKWQPQSIKDSVSNLYPSHKICEVYVLQIKNKTTYQTRIAKKSGLFRKREKDVKLLNFETNGKFIDSIDVK